jgi:thiol-disulfide isomerase/thioredoxin
MIFLPSIDNLNTEDSKRNLEHFKKHIGSGKQGFLFVYMDGCGPCIMTKPAWADINKHIKKEHMHNDNVIVAQINKDLFSELQNVGNNPSGFPTIRYVNKNGKIVEEYKSARSAQAFAEWIESKLPKHPAHNHTVHRKSRTRHYKQRVHNRKNTYKRGHKRGGGKWSLKYKRSINCRRPKGFSQRQYCKYSRKK